MTKYDFILMSGDADAFLEKLQSVGVVDISRSLKPIDEKSEKLSARAEVYRKALAALKTVEKADNPGQKPTDFAVEVMETVREKEVIEAQLPQLRKEADELVPWGQFDAKSFDRLKETGLKLHFYKAKAIDPAWKEQYALSEISDLGGYSYFVVVSENEEGYDFPLKELPAPDRDFAAVEQQIAELEAQVKQKEHRLAQLKWYESEIQEELDKSLSSLDLHLAHLSGEKAAEDYLTVFEGFAPAETEPALIDMLEKEQVLYLVDKAKVEDNPPIQLKNNKFVSMFELLTDMYGRPKYDEFDPTVFISIFFMLFFAFCMGDMGYGLVLIGASLALKKVLGKIAPLGVTLGIATTVVGFLFHTFFSMDMLQWTWIPDAVKQIMLPSTIAGYDGTMVLALLVGIVHICLAMIMKTYQATKTKGFANSLGTWGWTLLIVGGVIVGGLALMGVMDKALTKWIVIILGSLSALGIFFLNDLHRNPLMNFGY